MKRAREEAGEVQGGEAQGKREGKAARVTDVKVVAATKWVQLQTLSYQDRHGQSRQWDMVQRTTRQANSDLDAVEMLAVVRGGELREPHTILVKQFRPPANKPVIELPAGLIDAGETPAQAAVRELKEETGFAGTVVGTSRTLFVSPGLTNETSSLVRMDVNLDARENANPKQVLEDDEDIEVLLVPLATLADKLRELENDGCVVYMGVHLLACGLASAAAAEAASRASQGQQKA